MMTAELDQQIAAAVDRQRIIDTVTRLVAIPSPTGNAGAVLDDLAEMLTAEGFAVERPAGDHPTAPAVAVRYDSGKPGKTIQFNGHVDTVHLPFVPPGVEGDRMTGSGSCDMKGGTAAAIEALRVLRDQNLLPAGSVLFTAHDLHEAPWGLGQQLNALIRDGYQGDAVLIPEYLNDCIPMIGRGSATWKIRITRPGPPVHEVLRPADEPSVIDAGSELAARLRQLNTKLSQHSDPRAGSESVFIGQIHSGEIYNQFPQECWLEGTRRWLPGNQAATVEQELRGLVAQVAQRTRTSIDVEFLLVRDAFWMDENAPLMEPFQQAYACLAGKRLALGAKQFVDDGNSFWALGGIPTITHGPTGGGPHTVHEWVSIDDMVRVARLYALTAVAFCGTESVS
jgi:acetylornithine deacetylase/succinyl-diaminopimelate desuccinylase-like protein